jgi:hypothetical protein
MSFLESRLKITYVMCVKAGESSEAGDETSKRQGIKTLI